MRSVSLKKRNNIVVPPVYDFHRSTKTQPLHYDFSLVNYTE